MCVITLFKIELIYIKIKRNIFVINVFLFMQFFIQFYTSKFEELLENGTFTLDHSHRTVCTFSFLPEETEARASSSRAIAESFR